MHINQSVITRGVSSAFSSAQSRPGKVQLGYGQSSGGAAAALNSGVRGQGADGLRWIKGDGVRRMDTWTYRRRGRASPGGAWRAGGARSIRSRQATAAVVRCFVGTFSRVRVPSQRTGPRQQPGIMAGGRRCAAPGGRAVGRPQTRARAPAHTPCLDPERTPSLDPQNGGQEGKILPLRNARPVR